MKPAEFLVDWLGNRYLTVPASQHDNFVDQLIDEVIRDAGKVGFSRDDLENAAHALNAGYDLRSYIEKVIDDRAVSEFTWTGDDRPQRQQSDAPRTKPLRRPVQPDCLS